MMSEKPSSPIKLGSIQSNPNVATNVCYGHGGNRQQCHPAKACQESTGSRAYPWLLLLIKPLHCTNITPKNMSLTMKFWQTWKPHLQQIPLHHQTSTSGTSLQCCRSSILVFESSFFKCHYRCFGLLPIQSVVSPFPTNWNHPQPHVTFQHDSHSVFLDTPFQYFDYNKMSLTPMLRGQSLWENWQMRHLGLPLHWLVVSQPFTRPLSCPQLPHQKPPIWMLEQHHPLQTQGHLQSFFNPSW